MSEKDQFSSRLKRYVDVSTALGGAALKFAGNQLFGWSVDDQKQALSIAQALGQLKGPVMKIAQMLSTIPDAIAPEYAVEFQHLQSQAPPMGWSFVKRRMQTELGVGWQQQYADFQPEAAAAASLGQVHKAVLKEGTTVACKLQYPDMASVVEADLRQLKIILKIYESTIGALRTDAIFSEIEERLREELDYELEAEHIYMYQRIFASASDIHVPLVMEKQSTRRLLTMSWLEGQSLYHFKSLDQDLKRQMAKKLFYAWYYPFYFYGIIHGDPHLGNYTFQQDGSLNILDFGCIRKFKPSFVEAVILLYESLKEKNRKKAMDAYHLWGFTDLSPEILEVLNMWALLLYEPLLEDRVRPIQREHKGVYGRETATKIHQELRRLGKVTPPKEFVFMDRAAVGIGSAFMHLEVEVNWYQEFHALIHDYSSDKIKENQTLLFSHGENPSPSFQNVTES